MARRRNQTTCKKLPAAQRECVSNCTAIPRLVRETTHFAGFEHCSGKACMRAEQLGLPHRPSSSERSGSRYQERGSSFSCGCELFHSVSPHEQLGSRGGSEKKPRENS